MGDVLDRWRLNQGWNPWDNDTQMAAIASYVHTLDREGVPASAYGELYERVLSARAAAIHSGKQLPNFGAELMLASWPSLRAEIEQRRIDSGRILPDTAASQCNRCNGTGLENVYDIDGRILGVRAGRTCEHAPMLEGDGLWAYMQRNRQAAAKLTVVEAVG